MTPPDRTSRRDPRIAIPAVISILGLFFHNWWDLPHLTLLSPENSGPAAVFVLLIGLWWWRPSSKIALRLLLAWAVIHLVGGGIVSVIPFEFLPFYPEQSLRHYLGHIVYISSQIPLIRVTVVALRRGTQSAPP